jgi:hypothetical protein
LLFNNFGLGPGLGGRNQYRHRVSVATGAGLPLIHRHRPFLQQLVGVERLVGRGDRLLEFKLILTSRPASSAARSELGAQMTWRADEVPASRQRLGAPGQKLVGKQSNPVGDDAEEAVH